MIEMYEDSLRTALLFDFYGDLLTERQREFYILYFSDDLSLAEIADEFDISRQGVRDIIVRATKTLEDIEEKTGTVHRYLRTRSAISKLRDLCEQFRVRGTELKDEKLEELCWKLNHIVDDLEGG